MRKKIQKLLASVQKNFRIFLFFLVGIVSVLIAFPAVQIGDTSFDGVDITDLTRGVFNWEFKFSPSLDVYGGAEAVYSYFNMPASGEEEVDLAAEVSLFDKRLRNIGLNDYEIYIRENTQGSQEIVARFAKTETELQIFNELLRMSGDVGFSKAVLPEPVEGEDQPVNQQPQYVPTTLSAEDVDWVALTYTADEDSGIAGYRLIVNFGQDNADELLLTAVSDVNQSNDSQLFLTVSGQPIASQRYAVSSQARDGQIVFISYLGEDYLANALLKDMIENPHLNQSLNLSSIDELPGKYDSLIPLLEVLFVGFCFVLTVGLSYKYRQLGLRLAGVVLFNLAVAFMLFKVLGLQAHLLSLVAFVGSFALWFVHSRKLFYSFLNGDKIENVAKLNVKVSTSFRNFLIFAVVGLFVLINLGIPSLSIFVNYFAVTMLACWFGYYLATPVLFGFAGKVNISPDQNGKKD